MREKFNEIKNMSKFKTGNATGKAGEHYFAYWIMSTVGWPCRLMDIDIGIDAQIEILNEKQHSTGDFIAVQIKTTGSKIPEKTVYKKHLEYWKDLDDELIYVSISNFRQSSPTIYWKHLNKETISMLRETIEKNGTNSVELDIDDTDTLSESNVNVLAKLKYVDILDTYISKEDELNEAFANLCHFFTIEEYCVGNYVGEKWVMKGDLDETSVLCLLSDADNVLKTFNAINDIESQFPKIANIANVKVDWDRHEDVEEIVKVLVRYTKNMQEEILTSWKESNPKSAINELF